MRIFGADVAGTVAAEGTGPATLVVLGDGGRIATSRQAVTLADLARIVAEITDDEPFVLGVNVPVVVPARSQRTRSVENLIRRRLGHRLPPGGRATLGSGRGGVGGEGLLTALGAVGLACLPYPDRDRRASGLAEIWPRLVLKALLWETSPAAGAPAHPHRENALRAFEGPAYRIADAPRAGWAERAASLDLVLRALEKVEDLDRDTAREALATAASDREVEWVGGLFDAALIATTARRYLDDAERSVFVGDREDGYVILPADPFLRRVALREAARPGAGRLFPSASLRERLSAHAALRPLELMEIPGRPQRIEAILEAPARYEFDNLDEMLWWKHCRHLSGPELPVEGLVEMLVRLGDDQTVRGEPSSALRLARSRHKVLSFRFEPPQAWRARIATRDGKTYRFNVERAVYETRPAG